MMKETMLTYIPLEQKAPSKNRKRKKLMNS